MIARINGTLIYKSVNHVIVDAHGIGYRIFIPLTTFYELPETNRPVTLSIHTYVKQDAISLFGFNTDKEKDIFQLMISVTGIGPRLAMNILSGISAEELIRAVSKGSLDRLTGIPGVGKKMAGRMILELKDKVIKISPEDEISRIDDEVDENEQVREDALSALINLGYKSNKAGSAVDKIISELSEPVTLDVLLKTSLKMLAG